MHHYPHHIGDFNNATRHLSRIERSIYRDLIEIYHDQESPLPDDIQLLCRKVIARSDEEKEAVKVILEEFFTLEDSGVWTHAKCDSILEKYFEGQEATDQRRANERARQQKSRAKRKKLFEDLEKHDIHPAFNTSTQELVTLLSRVTSQGHHADVTAKPRTKNQEPRTKNQQEEQKSEKPEEANPYNYDLSTWPDLPDVELFKDWLKAKRKAKGQVSQRALNSIGKNLTELKARGFSVNFCLEKAESSGWKGIEIHYFDRFTPDIQSNNREEQVQGWIQGEEESGQLSIIEGECSHVR